MGKATGFMEYEREGNGSVSPKERIRDFSEFKIPMSGERRREQASRCMNCGVPFCQAGAVYAGMMSGCPLHNLIPEWNDEIYRENWREALSRLLKTNNFPEFTGRVCPALCEAACTCGLNGQPVTVHDNELAIIEKGFENGWMTPQIPEVRSGKRVAVVGSGPSGLAVADQLNQRGHSVTVFERDRRPGGLLMYGIPNMKLDKKIVSRRIDLMKSEGIIFRTETDVGKDISFEELKREFDAIVICCGAKKPRDLKVEGRDVEGVYFAVDFLSMATEKVIGDADGFAITAKDKNVIIVGGGDTGNDCVGTCIRQGCKSVAQLEMLARPPLKRAENNPWPQWPRVCKTDYGQEESIAVFGGDPRIYQTTVKKFHADDKGNLCSITTVKLTPKKDEASGRTVMTEVEGSEEDMPCELLLIAAGFVGCEDYVAEAFGAEKNARGCISTENGKYSTSVKGVFAAGDGRRGQSLVVHAIAEGRACAKEVDEYLMGYSNMI